MSVTLPAMKTIQVRIPEDLADEAVVCGRMTGERLTAYVTRVIREAVKRDLPRAAKHFAKRAEQTGREDSEE